MAQHQCNHNEKHRCHHQLNDGGDLQSSAGGEGHHHSQNHNSKNVVQYRRSDHDLAFTGAQITELTEHAGSDADAGGRHRSSGKDRLNGIDVEDPHQSKGAQGEGQHDAHHGNGERLSADGDQLL